MYIKVIGQPCNVGIRKGFARVECVVVPVGPEVLGADGVVVAVGVERGRPGGVADVPILDGRDCMNQILILY